MQLSCHFSTVYAPKNTVIIRSFPFRVNKKIDMGRKPINLLI